MLKEGYNMSKIVFGVQVQRSLDKYTPLEFVVYKNNLPLVQFLLEIGVNPNVEGPAGDTPLIISIQKGFHQISEKLIILGANTCKPDKNGKTPLYWAVNKKNINIINLLLDHGAELTIHTALFHAIDSGYLDMVQLLVERGAPLNVVSGATHLIGAISRGNLYIAKYLIKSGADVNLTSEFGNLPVKMCIKKINSEMMQEHP
jgi:ankyrin repeat protein